MSLLDKASLIQIPSGYKNGKLYSVKPTPTYGSELVVNGDFATDSDWSKGSGWSIGGGKATSTTASSNLVCSSATLVVGKKYKFSIDSEAVSSGSYSFLIRFNSTNTDVGRVSSDGSYVFYAVADSTSFRIQTLSGGSTSFSIDNVSVKEVLNDGDFDFSRSSSATRVNSEGLIETAKVLGTTELVTNGDFATNSDWSGSKSISGGQLTKTNGGLAYQSGVVTANKYYKVVVDVESLDGATQLYFGGNQYTLSVGVQTIEAVGGTSNDFVGFNNGYSSGSGSVFNSISVIEYIENDVPRLDYSDGSCASLLLEGQSTNLYPYSNDFTQWTIQSGVTATYNTTETLSPDGTNNATKFVGNGTSGVFKSTAVTGVVARSVYLKSVSGTVNVILKDPVLTVTQKSLSVTTEWQRFDLIEDNTHSSSQGLWIDDIPSSGIYMWGAQLEQGNLTSYIPTSGATVTRTADVCNNAGTSATFNSTEGVLFAEIAALEDDLTNRIISLSEDGNTNNRVNIFYTTGSNKIKFTLRLNGANEFSETITLSNILDYNKVALRFAENNFAVYINGVKEEEQLSGSTYSANTLDKLSFDQGGGSYPFYGKTKQLMVFDEALSDEELSDLTGQANTSFAELANFYNYTIL